jgi:hypothetical protein
LKSNSKHVYRLIILKINLICGNLLVSVFGRSLLYGMYSKQLPNILYIAEQYTAANATVAENIVKNRNTVYTVNFHKRKTSLFLNLFTHLKA